MFIILKRIINTAVLGLKRQGLPTFAVVFVLVITCVQVSSIFVLSRLSHTLIKDLQQKVDISVYLKSEVSEEQILALKEKLSKDPKIREIEYISATEAKDIFVKRHQNQKLLMESLAQVGNPFLASLNIQAFTSSQYQKIAQSLKKAPFKDLIQKVDYHQRKTAIKRIFALSSGIKKILLGISLILGIVAVLVTFNTIRLAIYSSKEEIEVQRLVGASNWFIRGPFLVQGFLMGVFSALMASILLGGVCFSLSSSLKTLWSDLNLWLVLRQNLGRALAIQFSTGAILGVFSSWIAIRRYLKI